ncbi:SRPBCC family protein [Nocardia yamanashiensis]|uniref:SRPBCC family protein n=1 Tax=Nocardia yamanashiensis TaxID=209247 RepID=UPI001E2E0234|nr:SRPBCC family protein [Nocardia yamanashiensis]UGT42572.1 SRPBCC family protein [Nocardia yamanashiensis]
MSGLGDLEESLFIASPPRDVWRAVSRLNTMPQWSPQCRRTIVFGKVRPGTWIANVNNDGRIWWLTTARVVACDENRMVAWRINENRMRWSYTVTPVVHGTQLTVRRSAVEGQSQLSRFLGDHVFGGNTKFDQRVLHGMRKTLSNIKKSLERSPLPELADHSNPRNMQ